MAVNRSLPAQLPASALQTSLGSPLAAGPYGGSFPPTASPTGGGLGGLPPLRRSASGAGIGIDRSNADMVGSSGLRAVRTARLLNTQLEQLAPAHLLEVRKALATLQGAGVQEVADVSGLHEVVVSKVESLPSQGITMEPEVMLAPALQAGLVFDFTQEQLADTDAVGKGLIGLRTLRSLRLRFTRCATLNSVTGLGKGFRELSALKELHMDFAYCTGLSTVDDLAKGISKLHGVDTLYLNFQGCTGLTSVQELGKAIALLTAVKTLTLNFQDCTGLTSDAAVALGSAIAGLKNLIDLDLNVYGSRVKRGVQRPTILEPGPLGITNYMLENQP